MKNLALIFSILFVGFSTNQTSAKNNDNHRKGYNGNAYIFVEGDVEFSVFPDGQFDFVYIGPQTSSQVVINTPNVNISFNSGYDYETYVQYDDYGAVIQVENVPIYYDEYGRITQAGSVDIRYNNRRIVRVGGLNVIYNNYGYFSHCSGVINMHNPYYVYRPWHVYYAPPIYTHCVVYDMPYRRYYSPVRYSYHDHLVYYKNRSRTAYHNGRRDFYRPGSRIYDKNGRATVNRNYNPNRANTMVASNNTRTNSTLRSNQTQRNSAVRNNDSRNSRVDQTNVSRSGSAIRNSSINSKGATSVDRSTRSSQRNSSTASTRNRENAGENNSIRKSNTSTKDVKAIRGENSVRSQQTQRTNNGRNVENQQTQRVSSKSTRSTTSSAKVASPNRQSAGRKTVSKSNTASRSSDGRNSSRGNTTKEVGSRGRG
ncbi:hypothetical protein QRD02_06425 [Aequorivita sp. SDUM287046]|uniref:DUF3300 domain-containing protein n=1 Tax=Aequorivita aurantiaca TaxID=3053356 RepID=A0ABT8DJ81_9FLAO|nr:hypothetical protein [Aequorivita aurantiaca]MDN3724011.1 hypothetical protein [Aequorivita aurantiaca]